MKTSLMLGLLLIMGLASVVSANWPDYNLYVQSGASLRYLDGPTAGYDSGVFTYPMGGLGDYRVVEFYSPTGYSQIVSDCPRTNGVPICS